MATQTLSATLDASGNAQVTFTPAAPGKYVFNPAAGSPLIGIYQGTQPIGANGLLRIDPGTRRGVRTLPATVCLCRWISGAPGAPVSLSYRPWTFWDYFYIG